MSGGLPYRRDAGRYLSDENYRLWRNAMQAGEHVGDDAVWARVLAAEKARREAASRAPERSRIAQDVAAREQARALAEITAARQDADRAAWERQKDLLKRLGDLGM